MIISRGRLSKYELKDKIIIVTGGGGGIGFEACRSLIWLGAKVIIAEINKETGKKAEGLLNNEFGKGSAIFIHTDIGSKKSVRNLVNKAKKTYGKIDVVINNATVAEIGAVHLVGINKWDRSYRTNLRGPVLLTSYVLPDMLKRNSGVIVFVPSSGAAPYMGAYEVFKTAQIELSNTLSAELEATDVITYSIGPGIVKTKTANDAIEKLAPLYGKSVDEFYRMSEHVMLTAEEAGAGFAASVVLADKYRGLEIGSIQALMDSGISINDIKEDNKDEKEILVSDIYMDAFRALKKTFEEQVRGWQNRPLFERQWILRDFKKHMGESFEYYIHKLDEFENKAEKNKVFISDYEGLPLKKIHSYYNHQLELMKGYEKNPDKAREHEAIINGWLLQIEHFMEVADELII